MPDNKRQKLDGANPYLAHRSDSQENPLEGLTPRGVSAKDVEKAMVRLRFLLYLPITNHTQVWRC